MPTGSENKTSNRRLKGAREGVIIKLGLEKDLDHHLSVYLNI